jgi:hypothetical protein
MRQIEDSWKINAKNPSNEMEIIKNLHEKSELNDKDTKELKGYRINLIKNLINTKCSSICLNAKNTNFKNCFDNCEAKFQNADQIFFQSKNEFNEFKKLQSFNY